MKSEQADIINANNNQPSAFGAGFNVQDFYLPFTPDEITPQNMPKWPYYKHVSPRWDEYALHGTEKYPSMNPSILTVAPNRIDLNQEYKDGKSFIQSFTETQTKAFVVIQNNQILAEYYSNRFNIGQINLLQSASKTFAGVFIHQLADGGLIDHLAKVADYSKQFNGTSLGMATVQQVLDMLSGMPTVLDFHTQGSMGQRWEVEIGLQSGEAKGHCELLKSTQATESPGEVWQYTDMNTDTLAIVAEAASGKPFVDLLSELCDVFGANDTVSIAKNSDGGYSPCYGISISARDYALFHQWIACGKAPTSYYASVKDPSKNKLAENGLAASVLPGVRYGSQSYYIFDDDVIFSSGSYGQNGYSDLKSGIAVVFMSDWAVNWEVEKGNDNRHRAIMIINEIRSKPS